MKPLASKPSPRVSFDPLTQYEIENFVKEYPGVEFVNCMIVDMLGLIRGKQVKVSKLRGLTQPDMTLPKSIFLQNSMGEIMDIPAIPDVDPDYFAQGISGTLQPALWSSLPFVEGGGDEAAEVKKAHVFLNLMDGRGRPFVYNGRELVKKVTAQIKKEFGYRVTIALELEFYLFAQKLLGASHSDLKKVLREETHLEDFQMLEPANHLYHYPYLAKANSECYGVNSVESLAPFTDRLLKVLSAQGIETDGLSSEYGNGQFEVNLKHVMDPVMACDQAILMKYSLKNLAKQFGLNATFMAVPNLKSPNGMHINLSLQDDSGRNVFFRDPSESKKKPSRRGDGDSHISDVLLHALGGLEATADDAMLIFAPNFNSYRRYYSQGFSPGDVKSWGVNNRTVSFRIPGFNKKNPNFSKVMRLEHRLAGADSNPYLATAAVLVGVYWGLKKRLLPSPMKKSSTYRTQLWESDIPSMATSLQAWKQKSNIFRHFFGADFCDTFHSHRTSEWNVFLRSLTQLDFDWYSQY